MTFPGGATGASLLYLVVAAVYTWPLVLNLTTRIPHDAFDPVLNTWILWWNTQAVPLTAAWWSPPIFFPAPGALAFSEHLLGLAPVTTPLQWVGLSPLTAYNVVFLLSFPATALATYALCRRLTGNGPASVLAGLYFGFTPYRAGQLAHLQVLCVYFLPVVLLALHAYHATRRRGWLVVFGLGWLLLALSCGYYFFFASVLVASWIAWFALRKDARAVALGAGAAWVVATLPLVPILWGYYTIQRDYGFTRDREQIESYSADLLDVAAAPALSIWSHALPAPQVERALFPGIAVVVAVVIVVLLRSPRAAPGLSWRASRWLAALSIAPLLVVAVAALAPGAFAVGGMQVSITRPHKPAGIALLLLLGALVVSPPVRRAYRAASVPAFYLTAAAFTACLSLGPEAQAAGVRFWYRAPYAWLMAVPGWSGVRVPARFWMLTLLCLSVLVAFALARLVSRWPHRRRLVYSLAAAVIVLDIAIEPIPLVEPPPAPDLSAEAPSAVVAQRPFGGGSADTDALYHMISHGRPIVNGYSGYTPPHYRLLEHFEKRREPGTLERLGLNRPIAPIEAGGVRNRVPPTPRSGVEDLVIRCGAMPSQPDTSGLRRLGVQVRDPATGVDVTRETQDGRPDTGWRSGGRQRTGTAIDVHLSEHASVCAIVLELGAWPLEYPRQLDVLASGPGPARQVWSGPTGLLALDGAVRCQRDVPIVLLVPGVSARELRLQLQDDDTTAAWWIAELDVWAARAGTACPSRPSSHHAEHTSGRP